MFEFDEELVLPPPAIQLPEPPKSRTKLDLNSDRVLSSLVIVTPAPNNTGASRKAVIKEENRRYVQPHCRKSATNELVDAINDGLFFYEQDVIQNKEPKAEIQANVTVSPDVTFAQEPLAPPAVHLYPSKQKSKKKKIPRKRKGNRLSQDGTRTVGWMMKSNQSPSTSPSASPKTGTSPGFQHPSRSLLENDGFIQHKYDKFRARCLKGSFRLFLFEYI